MKAKVEQIIRSQSISFSQTGYEKVIKQLGTREGLTLFEFVKIYKHMDWLSQDGYEGDYWRGQRRA